MLKRVIAFAPGHVTGLFYMQDQNDDPLHSGSLGAGFSLEKGTYSAVEKRKKFSECSITINGQKDDAPVSRELLKLFFEKTGIKPQPIDITHSIETPQGAGFGSSGSGALSLVYALNRLYDDPLTSLEASGIAHVAEVICKTGLGTVMGETLGGFKVLVKVGAPGIGKTLSISYPPELYAVFIVFGPLSTKDALSDKKLRQRIIKAGKEYHGLIIKDPVFDSFLKYSRNFAEETGFISKNVRAAMDFLDKAGINSSMLMFGDGTFSIISKEKLEKTTELAYKFCKTYTESRGEVFISNIAERGVGIVSED